MPSPRIPSAPNSIQKGSSLAMLLDTEAIQCLAHNLKLAHPSFDSAKFHRLAKEGIEPLGILDRGHHLAAVMRKTLPTDYKKAIRVIVKSLTPPQTETDSLGLAVFFYLPHVFFVSDHGLEPDDFETSMQAQYELTRRFSAEFSIRPFLIRYQDKTLEKLQQWMHDPCPHVRRLCTEGTRPRLPWAMRIPAFIKDPRPALPILEHLKDDPDLYVRRSVANHLGDIAKDHPQLVFDLAHRWVKDANEDRKWLIRHAVRHPAKHEHPEALKLRQLAKPAKVKRAS
jgi:3-methyladenine DNA glycosylase AlkC